MSRKEASIETCITEWEKDYSISAAVCGNYKYASIKDGTIPLPPLWQVDNSRDVNLRKVLKQCDKVLFDKKRNLVNNINQLGDIMNKCCVDTEEVRMVTSVMMIHCVSRCAPCSVYRFNEEIFNRDSTSLRNLLRRLTTFVCILCGGLFPQKEKSIAVGYCFSNALVCMLRNGLDSIPPATDCQYVDADCADTQTIITTDVMCRIIGENVEDVDEQCLTISRELCLRSILERAFSIGFHPSGLRGVLNFIESEIEHNPKLSEFLSLYPNICNVLKHRIED